MLAPVSDTGAPPARDGEIAEVFERLRAGVRQRQAELACLDQQSGELPAFLAAVRREATLVEPSFRTEGAGALRSFVERAFYVLFARRQHRTLLAQQNRFNRNVELALSELHGTGQRLASELRAALAREDAGAREDALARENARRREVAPLPAELLLAKAPVTELGEPVDPALATSGIGQPESGQPAVTARIAGQS
jgi:hypothetical protein